MPENVPDIFAASPAARGASYQSGIQQDPLMLGAPSRSPRGTVDIFGASQPTSQPTTPSVVDLAMPDPTAGESFGNMLLDVFALPEIAFFDRSVRGMIYAAAKGEGVEGILTRFLRGSPIAAAVEFATGADWHDNISGEEMMKALGVENPGFLVSTLGAIATGPSTFVGLGALTKLGKAFRAGQIYAAGVGLAEGAEGLMQLRRGKELLQLGTREAIESVGGQVGARVPLSHLSLSEQAKIGAQSWPGA